MRERERGGRVVKREREMEETGGQSERVGRDRER